MNQQKLTNHNHHPPWLPDDIPLFGPWILSKAPIESPWTHNVHDHFSPEITTKPAPAPATLWPRRDALWGGGSHESQHLQGQSAGADPGGPGWERGQCPRWSRSVRGRSRWSRDRSGGPGTEWLPLNDFFVKSLDGWCSKMVIKSWFGHPRLNDFYEPEWHQWLMIDWPGRLVNDCNWPILMIIDGYLLLDAVSVNYWVTMVVVEYDFQWL